MAGLTIGQKLIYDLKDGEEYVVTPGGLIITHPERKAKLVRWDGSEELIDAYDRPVPPVRD
jgi:hypothetical protein